MSESYHATDTASTPPHNFAGFDPPTANFTPTPNQFFDRIVGFYDPCVVVVVAVLIRETLGWQNKFTGGRKIEAALPLSEFIKHGISKESARKGLRIAIEAGFIIKTEGASPRDPARYALRWSDSAEQTQAIRQERLAFGAHKTTAGGLRDTLSSKRVLKSRTLKSSILKNSTPVDGALKETLSGKEKKKESEKVLPSALSRDKTPEQCAIYKGGAAKIKAAIEKAQKQRGGAA